MVAADPHVDGFAPQVYWFDYPAAGMWPRPDLPPGAHYTLKNPASYARLCTDMWRHYTAKPLVITGQAYWTPSEGDQFDQAKAEAKLDSFLHDMTDADWSRIVGLNWWHFGHKATTPQRGQMSPAMAAAIATANLGAKPYAAA